MPLLHRIAVTAALTTAAGASTLAPAGATPLPLPLPFDGESSDRLVITVSETGEPDDAATYVLACHPTGGTHPRARAACAQLDSETEWGRDPFAPVPPGAMCTGQYGGSATARVTGHWAGRHVNAWFNRTNGCEIARWNRFSIVLRMPGS
ncbi:SSI family serine proteinase inhibitor [Streptomyces luomodiensis]|uniref:SSI family serine proteinase inhibitor n=1 Tax=Streptomyces luomodiensis TaxID=3026192 RepID=A0ABY9UYJ1_9ACTN|nr:SSI family serine proteinase inhibitor [Streptomyces sp. SCA4-21]WNE97583.1 SSI family serine proteinase inhibitor [Streptomyces sp. SCA4-21]